MKIEFKALYALSPKEFDIAISILGKVGLYTHPDVKPYKVEILYECSVCHDIDRDVLYMVPDDMGGFVSIRCKPPIPLSHMETIRKRLFGCNNCSERLPKFNPEYLTIIILEFMGRNKYESLFNQSVGFDSRGIAVSSSHDPDGGEITDAEVEEIITRTK